eukprot:maker-scaffold516_size150393-snap-gene-0.26 protein:Tk06590 transcript:maker-scaffold516_size150393-snap-gene-0.26-mRNA-1 annotation:"sam-dependent methyltransferase"
MDFNSLTRRRGSSTRKSRALEIRSKGDGLYRTKIFFFNCVHAQVDNGIAIGINKFPALREASPKRMASNVANTFTMRVALMLMSLVGLVTIGPSLSAIASKTRSMGISDPNNCALRMHKAQEFQGREYTIIQSKKKLKGHQKSLKIEGQCCWAIYRHHNFKGQPMLLGKDVSIGSIEEWGWRRAKIRSVKRLKSCKV